MGDAFGRSGITRARSMARLIAMAMVVALIPLGGIAAADDHANASHAGDPTFGGPVRQLDLGELGVSNPSQVVWLESDGRLGVVGETSDGSPALVTMHPSGRAEGAPADLDALDEATAALLQPQAAPEVDATADPNGESVEAATRIETTDPLTGHSFIASGSLIQEFSPDGDLVGTVELAGLTPESLAVGASADPTDDPSTQSLFLVADQSGEPGLFELRASTAFSLALAAETLPVTLIRTTQTSGFNPPSPDPSGIAFIAASGRLMISDGEVNEMSIFQNANVFEITRNGSLLNTYNTLPESNEPTGIAFNPNNGHYFFSDDTGARGVYEYDPGADGVLATGDDIVTQALMEGYGSFDPEGVAFDSSGNALYVTDGVAAEIYRLTPGPNGTFEGSNGDDIKTQFDVASLGIRDPEGVEFNPDTGTLLVLGDNDLIAETTTSGSLIRYYDLASLSVGKAAGLAYAPGSADPSARHLYIVDRNIDNDSDPNENDGEMYEVAFGATGGSNLPPTVDAGPDDSTIFGVPVNLSGTVTDDGQPDPPGAVTTTWSADSGPGTVAFGDASLVSTTADFSSAGTYVLRLTADDGGGSIFDTVTVFVADPTGAITIERRVSASSDDAEELQTGSVSLNSSDLEMVFDSGGNQTVGMRFLNISIPQGSEVVDAWVQFTVDETPSNPTSLTIRGQAVDNAPTFTTASGSISSRPTTPASVAWSPAPWPTIGASGSAQTTPSLMPVIQQIVSRSGWVSGNALALIVTGTGERVAEAFNGSAAAAPLLHIVYRVGPPPPNSAPTVSAGPDATVSILTPASLDGTVTDEGLPNPPGVVTSTWSTVSGPGTVTFGDPSAVDTTATFSDPGTYVLRLTADDSELTSSDELSVTLSTVPNQTIQKRISVSSDDAEEQATGSVSVTNGDLELVQENTVQTVGLRFRDLQVPHGATIVSATVQFKADETHSGATSLAFRAQAADNAPTFQNVTNNISSRPLTAASAGWSPAPWAAVGDAGPAQKTSDIAAVVQEVVDRPGWVSGNALVVVVTGSGKRVAESYNGDAAGAPLLELEYAVPDQQRPVVDAGPNATASLPDSAALDGTVTDDGLPNPPGAVTTTWTKASGPGTVTFGDASAVDTTATFSDPGAYVLRLTADDGELLANDTVTITAVTAGSQIVTSRVAMSSDDAEEQATGSVSVTNRDLELVQESTVQTVGLRFQGLAIPAGATIVSATVQFKADETDSGATNLTFRAEASDNAPTFQKVTNNISSRPLTTAAAAWSPNPWTAVGAAGPDQKTSNISAVIQEIVDRPGWVSGNALVVVVTGSGKRVAESYNGDAAGAPLLSVTYTVN